MAENVASFDENLQKLVVTPFGTTAEELRIAAIGSKIEFAKSELQTVQTYIDVVYAGRVRVATDDGSELPIDCLAHLGSVLSNYEQMLFDQIADLEYQQEMLRFPPDKEEDLEDDGISDNQDA
ncbi:MULTISPECIES: hypothetical protein [Rhizobium]|jgi:hypothetical protein|uniref:Uncharacterized protein n=1 Tax=Rhizobium leguminosarum TaxID=384 RepID=A0A2Z4YH94_RHILE|nr:MULTISPECIES: hypothetical protein [Rhizobium]AXA39862.1 hypothetical protein DLJ82_2269 [Rhizobium leguminosarum]MBA8835178.1 hypothetical protein [Rhizobium leguminosarum]MCW1754993.1 hypothetical protein [Rhizobium acaciae]NEI65029.1 hypothetical protein [Rhizobium leguminosarum]TBE30840.1 hypothetical protein ELH05_24865 [Rhizobium ruizarguesonis]